MRTLAGTECRYYYEDFYRGHSTQECRLIGRHRRSTKWEPKLCTRCPVPGILRANACPNMLLEAAVVRRWLGLAYHIEVRTSCVEHDLDVTDPHVGCGHCHPQAITLLEAPETLKE